MLTIQYIYIFICIYLYYIKFTYVLSSTISGLLIFLPIDNKRARMQHLVLNHFFPFIIDYVFILHVKLSRDLV